MPSTSSRAFLAALHGPAAAAPTATAPLRHAGLLAIPVRVVAPPMLYWLARVLLARRPPCE